MKKLKYTVSILFVIVLFIGLWYTQYRKEAQYVSTEYLLDTRCVIRIYGEPESKAAVAAEDAFNEVRRIHELTDYYAPLSDVGKINAADGGEVVFADSLTMEVLRAALEVCERSDGAFDITVAPVKDLWNFSGEGRRPEPSELYSALEYVDWRGIELDFDNCSVTKKSDKIKIDLGGAAKGYAADRAAAKLRECGIKSALLDFGGNILTIGENPSAKDRKWRIGIQKPFAATGEYGRKLEISEGAVVTSGNYERFFELDGKRYHHILEPHTGFPSENGYDSVSIVHRSALIADCLSTACFVLGEERGRALAEEYGAEIYFDTAER